MSSSSEKSNKFLSILYGLSALKQLNSFLIFISMFLIIFLVGFFFIINYLGFGTFLSTTIYFHSFYSIIIAESSFIILILSVIFLICMLIYYKSYYIFSNGFRLVDLIFQTFKKFPKFLIAIFIQVSISFLGLLALIIPGIYYGSSVMFFSTLCVYTNSNLKSAFVISRDFAKKIRSQSLISFTVYFLILLIFFYLIIFLNFSFFYKGLLASILLSYWIVSYTNTIFNIVDREYNKLSDTNNSFRKF